ncbi:hypothetical protein RRF57_008949 [Xylaria bambusicola]|uniref:Uncharacterized protein n=1 Tax=Xylaria bambusicola TaxID=326684 RepID=A0AAN7UIR0_9PEZI
MASLTKKPQACEPPTSFGAFIEAFNLVCQPGSLISDFRRFARNSGNEFIRHIKHFDRREYLRECNQEFSLNDFNGNIVDDPLESNLGNR